MTDAARVVVPPHDEEKKICSTATTQDTKAWDETIDPTTERRLVRKCDFRVVLPTIILFTLCFIDRVNIGNARIQGMEADLRMHGTDYNVALLVLFIPFILLEIPSNLMMKVVSPSTWLSFLLAGCGRLSALPNKPFCSR